MLDRNLILCGLPAGLVLGVAVWMATGRGGAQADALQQAADALQAMRPAPRASAASAAPALSAPLFAQPEPGAVTTEISIVLQGVTRTPRRQAALVAIGGRPADWLTVGETRDEVTLEGVRASSITITTPAGSREITFGPSAPSAGGSASSSVFTPTADAGPPPGMRSPPPPASAPGAS